MTRGAARRSLVLLVALALVAAACGDDDGPAAEEPTEPTEPTEQAETAEQADPGQPRHGGSLVYGIEAETAGGWCLPEAQLAISGMQVARTIYDTLLVNDAEGEPSPWLAESFEVSDDFTELTLRIRDGVTFHDGSPLTGEVVKDNIDAWRGVYEGRSPLLLLFVYSDIADVELVDEMTVRITTVRPWPALAAYLTNPRFGMIAQSQLDNPTACDRELVGTGPFRFVSWQVNDRFVAERFDDWWFAEVSGVDYPFLDRVEYRPIIGGPDRLRALRGGEIDAGHFSAGRHIAQLREMAERGEINVIEADQFPEVGYVMLNQSREPFDDPDVRRALALTIDRVEQTQILGEGVGTPASGPFGPGNVGYLDDAGYPEPDLDEARALLDDYAARTGAPLSFTITSPGDPDNLETAQFLQQLWRELGLDVALRQIPDQSQYINAAVGGEYDAILWRNHPGGDPDGQYVWWHGASPVNFGRIADPEVDRLLDEGRVETDPEARRGIYEDLNRRFAEQVHNLWGNWTTWAIASEPDVWGVEGTGPADGGDPYPGFATGHQVHAIWRVG